MLNILRKLRNMYPIQDIQLILRLPVISTVEVVDMMEETMATSRNPARRVSSARSPGLMGDEAFLGKPIESMINKGVK